jgi:phenylalanyl-tRNA synthetase beta chain
MIVSWNWLTQYLDLRMSADALAERLALTGLNHESTEEVGGDLAIDLEVTSNRADCLCHLGVAREIGVLFGLPVRVPDPRPRETGPPVAHATSVTIADASLCPRFTARAVTGLKVAESPWWLRRRLETLGVRPISNVVDITNYVMFECGQPLHAYDLARLAGRRLVVRRARSGEKLVAINGKTYDLNSEMLAIADAERPVGLAGVMGGLETEINPSTTEILIEAARFDPMNVRRTSRSLGLMSPSSYRFERPIDPSMTDWASRRCAELVLELAGGSLHEGVIDIGGDRSEDPREPVTLKFSELRRVLGIDVPRERALEILDALGLERVSADGAACSYLAPSWRSDLGREIDLVEEVARIHGYEHIPEDRPVPVAGSTRSPRERVESALRDGLNGMGFDEAYTFSMVAESLLVAVDPAPVGPPLKADHSTRRRENLLRQSLAPSLAEALAYNESHGVSGAALFEIADVYLTRPGQVLPDERARLAVASGADFFALKGVVEALLGRLHVKGELSAKPVELAPFAPGRTAELAVGGAHLGYVGELDRAFLDRVGLKGTASAAELDLALLIERAETVPQASPVPAFPAVVRDLSLVVDQGLPWAELESAARKSAGPALESVDFLDTFAGGNIPPGRHSLHFAMTFRLHNRTLTGEEVERAVRSVADDCAARFGAALRA